LDFSCIAAPGPRAYCCSRTSAAAGPQVCSIAALGIRLKLLLGLKYTAAPQPQLYSSSRTGIKYKAAAGPHVRPAAALGPQVYSSTRTADRQQLQNLRYTAAAGPQLYSSFRTSCSQQFQNFRDAAAAGPKVDCSFRTFCSQQDLSINCTYCSTQKDFSSLDYKLSVHRALVIFQFSLRI